MKVIQIMPEFGLAGAETMCENLSYELMRQGDDVMIISLYEYHSAITERLEKKGIKVFYLDKKPGLDFSMIGKMIKIFKSEKPDVIHTHRYVMQYAIPAAIIAGVKHRVHTVHNVAQKENTNVARKVNYLFYKFAHVIPVALSEEVQKTIVEGYHIDSRNIPVIFNGIDLSKCIVKTNYEVNDYFNILHIGRFSEQKNHIGLIEAFSIFVKEHPNTILSLIGDGEKKEEIQQLVIEKGISDKVKFLGIKSNVYSYLNKADVFILPSIYEGVPMTLIEAMGTGLPIIATAVGGVPDMLRNDEEGLIVNCNVKEIADAMDSIYIDKKTREYLGKKALKRSKIFSDENMANEYKKTYLM